MPNPASNALLIERMTTRVLLIIAQNLAAQMALNERSTVTVRAVLQRAVGDLSLPADPAAYGIVDELVGPEPAVEALAAAKVILGEEVAEILGAAERALRITGAAPKLQG